MHKHIRSRAYEPKAKKRKRMASTGPTPQNTTPASSKPATNPTSPKTPTNASAGKQKEPTGCLPLAVLCLSSLSGFRFYIEVYTM